jgi:hypothetical protein
MNKLKIRRGIRQIYHLLIKFCSEKWNPTWRGLFDSISDIQKAVKSTLNTFAKDDF